jgi:hypothetical protein
MFRATLTLTITLCYRTTLALLTRLVLLISMSSARMLIKWTARMLAAATALCYRTTLALLTSLVLLVSMSSARMLIKWTARMLTAATALSYRTTLALLTRLVLLVSMFSARGLIKRTPGMLTYAMCLRYILCSARWQRCFPRLRILARGLLGNLFPEIVLDLWILHAVPTPVDLVGLQRLRDFRRMQRLPGACDARREDRELIAFFASELPTCEFPNIGEASHIDCGDRTSSAPLDLLV